jgi:hypothetical protein
MSLDQFKVVYKEIYGTDISDADALELTRTLIEVYRSMRRAEIDLSILNHK